MLCEEEMSLGASTTRRAAPSRSTRVRMERESPMSLSPAPLPRSRVKIGMKFWLPSSQSRTPTWVHAGKRRNTAAETVSATSARSSDWVRSRAKR